MGKRRVAAEATRRHLPCVVFCRRDDRAAWASEGVRPGGAYYFPPGPFSRAAWRLPSVARFRSCILDEPQHFHEPDRVLRMVGSVPRVLLLSSAPPVVYWDHLGRFLWQIGIERSRPDLRAVSTVESGVRHPRRSAVLAMVAEMRRHGLVVDEADARRLRPPGSSILKVVGACAPERQKLAATWRREVRFRKPLERLEDWAVMERHLWEVVDGAVPSFRGCRKLDLFERVARQDCAPFARVLVVAERTADVESMARRVGPRWSERFRVVSGRELESLEGLETFNAVVHYSHPETMAERERQIALTSREGFQLPRYDLLLDPLDLMRRELWNSGGNLRSMALSDPGAFAERLERAPPR
jgi:hypothetical protein